MDTLNYIKKCLEPIGYFWSKAIKTLFFTDSYFSVKFSRRSSVQLGLVLLIPFMLMTTGCNKKKDGNKISKADRKAAARLAAEKKTAAEKLAAAEAAKVEAAKKIEADKLKLVKGKTGTDKFDPNSTVITPGANGSSMFYSTPPRIANRVASEVPNNQSGSQSQLNSSGSNYAASGSTHDGQSRPENYVIPDHYQEVNFNGAHSVLQPLCHWSRENGKPVSEELAAYCRQLELEVGIYFLISFPEIGKPLSSLPADLTVVSEMKNEADSVCSGSEGFTAVRQPEIPERVHKIDVVLVMDSSNQYYKTGTTRIDDAVGLVTGLLEKAKMSQYSNMSVRIFMLSSLAKGVGLGLHFGEPVKDGPLNSPSGKHIQFYNSDSFVEISYQRDSYQVNGKNIPFHLSDGVSLADGAPIEVLRDVLNRKMAHTPYIDEKIDFYPAFMSQFGLANYAEFIRKSADYPEQSNTLRRDASLVTVFFSDSKDACFLTKENTPQLSADAHVEKYYIQSKLDSDCSYINWPNSPTDGFLALYTMVRKSKYPFVGFPFIHTGVLDLTNYHLAKGTMRANNSQEINGYQEFLNIQSNSSELVFSANSQLEGGEQTEGRKNDNSEVSPSEDYVATFGDFFADLSYEVLDRLNRFNLVTAFAVPKKTKVTEGTLNVCIRSRGSEDSWKAVASHRPDLDIPIYYFDDEIRLRDIDGPHDINHKLLVLRGLEFKDWYGDKEIRINWEPIPRITAISPTESEQDIDSDDGNTN